jgi:hypothetical protein
MPSFPAGSAIFGEFFTVWNYIIKYQADGDGPECARTGA